MSRWRAAGLHLGISAAIATAVVALMLAVWYPGPLFEAAGGSGLLFILVGVDVVLGPLMTLVIFRSGKWGLRFDLAAIGTVQALALAYGVHVVYLARPAFIVFVVDRFELATAADLDPRELAKAKYPQFRAPPLTGPEFAVSQMPADPAERNKVVLAAMAGLDLQNFPKYWAPYAERRAQVLAKAVTVAQLRRAEPKTAAAVDAYLKDSGTREQDVRCLMLRTRFAWLAVLVDPSSAEPRRLVLGEKILR
jgi:hypothetical protein